MQRSTQRVIITDCFLEHHVFFFSYWCVNITDWFLEHHVFVFFLVHFLSLHEHCYKARVSATKKQTSNNNIQQQQQQQQRPNDDRAGKFTRTHSPSGVDMNACSLLHIWLSSVTLAFFIVEFLLKISHRLDRFT